VIGGKTSLSLTIVTFPEELGGERGDTLEGNFGILIEAIEKEGELVTPFVFSPFAIVGVD
tara:strand:- start:29 stop:208 length:180 start_codon:yes stop_codon:yes gene_type:complete